MKKLLCIVLSLLMLVSATAMAEPTRATVHVNATSMGQLLVDVLGSAAYDAETGCYRFTVATGEGEQATEITVEVRPDAVVFGMGGQYYEIGFDTLASLCQSMVDPQQLEAFNAFAAYITSDAFANDMQTLGAWFSNELMRLGQSAFASGAAVMYEDGGFTVKFDKASMIETYRLYAASLCEDADAIATLTGTTLWTDVLGFSADGSAEFAYVAAFAADPWSLLGNDNGTTDFNMTVIFTADGSVTFNYDYFLITEPDAEPFKLLAVSGVANSEIVSFGAKLDTGIEKKSFQLLYSEESTTVAIEKVSFDTTTSTVLFFSGSVISAAWETVTGEETVDQGSATFDIANQLGSINANILGAPVEILISGNTATFSVIVSDAMLKGTLKCEDGLFTVDVNGSADGVNFFDFMDLRIGTVDGMFVIYAHANNTTDGVQTVDMFDLNVVINPADFTVNATCTDWNGNTVAATGAPRMEETGIAYDFDLMMNGQSMGTYTIGLRMMNQTAYEVYFTAGGTEFGLDIGLVPVSENSFTLGANVYTAADGVRTDGLYTVTLDVTIEPGVYGDPITGAVKLSAEDLMNLLQALNGGYVE